MEKKYNCDALKRLARQAKNRLGKRKYFNEKGEYKVYNGGYLADYKLVLLSNKEEEKMYMKVKEMLSQDEDAINPIGKLVDLQKFATLSSAEKDRYIITLADKYLKLKARFEREKTFSQEVC